MKQRYVTAAAVGAAAVLVGLLHLARSKRTAARPRASNSTEARQRARGSAAEREPCRLCIASCDELLTTTDGSTETYGTTGTDEEYLYAALKRQGIAYDARSWSDKSVDWAGYGVVIVRTTWDYSKSEAIAYEFRRWLAKLCDLGVKVYNHPRWVTASAGLPLSID